MVEGIEGVGDAVTGGVIARAVEPKAGESPAAEEHPETCLNCGAALVGSYCHDCGQSGHVHRTLTAWWHDLVHGVLHLDGKVWRTLPLLAWKPGELTRRYVEGERAKFVSPLGLFLFSVFLMFAVFSMVGGPFTADDNVFDRPEAIQELREEQTQLRETLDDLRSERETLAAAKGPTETVDGRIEESERELAVMERTARIFASGTEEEVQAELDRETREVQSGAETGWSVFDTVIGNFGKNPSLMAYKIQTNAYKFSWALIPISVPFLWLLFLHRRRYREYRAYDHTVFVTYSIAFMSLGLIALSLLRPLGIDGSIVQLAILIIPPLHIYRQLKGAYQLSRWSALWRTFTLVIFAFIAASLFFSLLVTAGAMT
ncbi:DUF3667 domain-containing protein [Allosphingosinicella sp.]|uniref:DUF3667 domain-containing protein n=1 Tax=Allosphingosinicella sp. TaxID=2823234 RepID=UPI002FC0FC66